MKTTLILFLLVVSTASFAQKTKFSVSVKTTNASEVANAIIAHFGQVRQDSVVVNKKKVINPESNIEMAERLLNEWVQAVYKAKKKADQIKALPEPTLNEF